MNTYEIIAFVLSIIGVGLNTREYIWGWPFAIAASFLYMKVFYDIQLYGDFFLQLAFVILSIYGWVKWKKNKGKDKKLKINNIEKKKIILLLLLTASGTLVVGQLLKYLNGDIVYIDAFTTVVSLIAQWMLARKYLENWWIWIFINTIYVMVYFYKAVYLTSVLYFIFIILAYIGLRNWKKIKSHIEKRPLELL